jgi:hypothetical protein
MPRGRNRNQNSKNGEDESVPTQTGQEEEIASPSPPRRGIPKEKEGMNQRDLSQKTPQRHTSLQRGTPEVSDPADASRKDRDSQTAYQHTAAALTTNAKPHSSEATLFVIDHTGVPPPTKA